MIEYRQHSDLDVFFKSSGGPPPGTIPALVEDAFTKAGWGWWYVLAGHVLVWEPREVVALAAACSLLPCQCLPLRIVRVARPSCRATHNRIGPNATRRPGCGGPSVVSASHLIGESDAVGPAATPSARGPPHRARSRPRGRSARPAQQAGVSITKGDGIKTKTPLCGNNSRFCRLSL